MSAYDGPRRRYRLIATFDFCDLDLLRRQFNDLDFRIAVAEDHGIGGRDEAIHLGNCANGDGSMWELHEVAPLMDEERFIYELTDWYEKRRAQR